MITPTIDDLREFGAKPEWFGLGFIQLKLTDRLRMHFWHPELKPDVPEEEIHDHRYTFTSTVIAGSLTHETYAFEPSPDGAFELAAVSCDPAQPVEPNPVAGTVRKTGTYVLIDGAHYTFEIGEFHRTRAVRAVTLLARQPTLKPFARVIRPKDAPVVCPFSKPEPVDRLWAMIADLLGQGDL